VSFEALAVLMIVGIVGAFSLGVYRLYRWRKLKREEKERVFDYGGM